MRHVVEQRHAADRPLQRLAWIVLLSGEQAELRIGQRKPGPVVVLPENSRSVSVRVGGLLEPPRPL